MRTTGTVRRTGVALLIDGNPVHIVFTPARCDPRTAPLDFLSARFRSLLIAHNRGRGWGSHSLVRLLGTPRSDSFWILIKICYEDELRSAGPSRFARVQLMRYLMLFECLTNAIACQQ